MKLIFKIFILLVLILGDVAIATKDVGLILWIDDNKATDFINYSHAMADLKKLDSQVIYRIAYATPNNLKYIFTDLYKNLKQGDAISTIMIGTHGATLERKNETSLASLGGFGTEGSFGLLSSIFSYLGEKGFFSPRLHIFLNSCSTLCGSQEKLVIRSEALFKELSYYGVEELSIWGAQQALIAEDHRSDSYAKTMIKWNKKVFPIYLKFMVFPIAGLANVWMITQGYSDMSIAYTREVVQLMLSVLGFLYVYVMLVDSVAFFSAGTKGYFLRMKSGETKISVVDLNNSFISKLGRTCKHFFK